jgi:hypothetical protein
MPATLARPRLRILPWILSAGLAIAGGAGWWKASRAEPARPFLRLHFDVPESTTLRQRQPGGVLAISADGARLALVLRKADSTILVLRQLKDAPF